MHFLGPVEEYKETKPTKQTWNKLKVQLQLKVLWASCVALEDENYDDDDEDENLSLEVNEAKEGRKKGGVSSLIL